MGRNDEDRLASERRRWFEQVVMVPVSSGMLGAFLVGAIGYYAHDPLLRLDRFVCRCSMSDAVEYAAAIIPLALAAATSVVAMIRWRRR